MRQKKISRLFIRGSLCHSLVCCGFFEDVFVRETGVFFSAVEQKKYIYMERNAKKTERSTTLTCHYTYTRTNDRHTFI